MLNCWNLNSWLISSSCLLLYGRSRTCFLYNHTKCKCRHGGGCIKQFCNDLPLVKCHMLTSSHAEWHSLWLAWSILVLEIRMVRFLSASCMDGCGSGIVWKFKHKDLTVVSIRLQPLHLNLYGFFLTSFTNLLQFFK